jgi:palmitoyltransferase
MAPSVVGSQTEKARNNMSPLEQRVGQATSVVMPLLELGAVGFVTWVVCYLICVQYLISPAADLRQRFDVQPRRGTGIALLVLYAILLLFILAPWLRVTQVIWSKPDLLPRGDAAREKKESDATPMEQYDAYICDHHGVPLYCDKCHIYKPDRAHHCKELGYCVRKMDHYCPWAGGIIAETSHKYFMQSVFFGAVYMAYSWVVTAIFLADRVQKVSLLAHENEQLLTCADRLQARDLDWRTRCRRALQRLRLHHGLHDGLQPRHQLHLCRSHPARRSLQHRLPRLAHLANADRTAHALE